jgi:hypothetical protein
MILYQSIYTKKMLTFNKEKNNNIIIVCKKRINSKRILQRNYGIQSIYNQTRTLGRK